MKKYIIITILNYLILSGCITKYTTTGIDEATDILVVEGVITDYESTITLTRSVNINEQGYWDPVSIDNANVYVECDDGTQTQPALYDPPNYSTAERHDRVGRYIVKTGRLNPERKYRLKIEIDNYEYVSDYSYPIKTPEIDSVFWRKRAQGEPVMIYIATRVPDDDVLYFRWSYKEDWEINSDIKALIFPYNCWCSYNHKGIFIGSSENVISDEIVEIITEIFPYDRRLSILYRIIVKQNAISKRAYDYFVNIKKNSENIGSIFAPTPSELRGNIVCITDPRRPVIGYIDISEITQKTIYVSKYDDLCERGTDCRIYKTEDMLELYHEVGQIPPVFVNYIAYSVLGDETVWAYRRCVDCTYYGTTQKPDDWPTSY